MEQIEAVSETPVQVQVQKKLGSQTKVEIKKSVNIVRPIIIEGKVSTTCDLFNNMCNGIQLPAGNGNLLNVDMSTVFVDHLNGDYHLSPGSPAIGSGYEIILN